MNTAIRVQVPKLIRLNKNRRLLTKFEKLIDSYNSGSRTIQEFFEELVTFSGGLTEEEHRHIREQLHYCSVRCVSGNAGKQIR